MHIKEVQEQFVIRKVENGKSYYYYQPSKEWKDEAYFYKEDVAKFILMKLNGLVRINTRISYKRFLKLIDDPNLVDIVATVLVSKNDYILIPLKVKEIDRIKTSLNDSNDDDKEKGIFGFYDKNDKVLYIGCVNSNLDEYKIPYIPERL
jgi:hypothetical protein